MIGMKRMEQSSITFADLLKKLNINKVIMLSGDNIDIVSKVGKEIKIKEYYGNLLPQDKIDKINEIKKEFLENYIFWKKINKIFVFLFIVFDILFVFCDLD